MTKEEKEIRKSEEYKITTNHGSESVKLAVQNIKDLLATYPDEVVKPFGINMDEIDGITTVFIYIHDDNPIEVFRSAPKWEEELQAQILARVLRKKPKTKKEKE